MSLQTIPANEPQLSDLNAKIPDSLRVRCPSCRKLYLVQTTDIRESKPRFACVQCHTKFWLSLAEQDLTAEIVGVPVQIRTSSTEKPVVSTSAPPVSSTLVAEKVPPHSAGLMTLWQKVLADFGSQDLHHDFVAICQRENNLPYAAFQYSQMLKLVPNDEIVNRMLGEIKALAMTGPIAQAAAENEDQSRTRWFVSPSRLWQLPLAIATVLVVVGLMIPFFRNLVGVGAALLFLALALQWQTRKI